MIRCAGDQVNDVRPAEITSPDDSADHPDLDIRRGGGSSEDAAGSPIHHASCARDQPDYASAPVMDQVRASVLFKPVDLAVTLQGPKNQIDLIYQESRQGIGRGLGRGQAGGLTFTPTTAAQGCGGTWRDAFAQRAADAQ